MGSFQKALEFYQVHIPFEMVSLTLIHQFRGKKIHCLHVISFDISLCRIKMPVTWNYEPGTQPSHHGKKGIFSWSSLVKNKCVWSSCVGVIEELFSEGFYNLLHYQKIT